MGSNEQRQSIGRKPGDKIFIGKESFPGVLYNMLDELESQGLADIVSWQPHGRCFLVHKRKEFIEDILPVYFRMSKFTSFQRQLNLYGFQRVATGKDKGGYFHDLFLRGRKDLCETIPRQQVKGVGKRMPVNPATQPDFYMMEYMPNRNDHHAILTMDASRIDSVTLTMDRKPSVDATTLQYSTANSFPVVESSLLASMYPSLLMESSHRSSAAPYCGTAESSTVPAGVPGCNGSLGPPMRNGANAPAPAHFVADGRAAGAKAQTTPAPLHATRIPPCNQLLALAKPPPLTAAINADAAQTRIPCLPSFGGDHSFFTRMNSSAAAVALLPRPPFYSGNALQCADEVANSSTASLAPAPFTQVPAPGHVSLSATPGTFTVVHPSPAPFATSSSTALVPYTAPATLPHFPCTSSSAPTPFASSAPAPAPFDSASPSPAPAPFGMTSSSAASESYPIAMSTAAPPPFALASAAPGSLPGSPRTNVVIRASAVVAAPLCTSAEGEGERENGNPLINAYAAALQSTYIEALHSAYLDALQSGMTETSNTTTPTRGPPSRVRRSSSSEDSLRDFLSQSLSCDDLNMEK